MRNIQCIRYLIALFLQDPDTGLGDVLEKYYCEPRLGEEGLQILISAEANGLRGLLMTSSPDLVSRRCRVGGTPLKLSGGLVLYCGLDDMRANFRSKDEDTGGDPGVRVILLKLPAMGMLLDMSDQILAQGQGSRDVCREG
jgi:hypothetical protein